MEKIRKPFQGVWNIIRFNRQYYILSFAIVAILLAGALYTAKPMSTVLIIIASLICLPVLISLIVSCYIYDFSSLYKLTWLNQYRYPNGERLVNIHAGFDETSQLIMDKFPGTDLQVFDFYDPKKHTEISIKRARKAYSQFPGTIQVHTGSIPLTDNSVDCIFTILSAHEIRNEEERVLFFKELHRTTKNSGQIIVAEHLRDFPNFLAYTLGFFHFHSQATWLHSFQKAGLRIESINKVTPFITIFILNKNEPAT